MSRFKFNPFRNRYEMDWVIKTTYSLTLFILLCLMTLNNIQLTIDSYYRFYEEESYCSDHNDNCIVSTIDIILSNSFIKNLLTYSGLETGFGFFAPNVASDFIPEFKFLHCDTLILSYKHSFPNVYSHESYIRLHTISSSFMNFVSDTSNVTASKIIFNSIGRGIYKQEFDRCLDFDMSSITMIGVLYLYEYPSLKSSRLNQNCEPHFIEVYSDTISLVNYD